MNGDSLVIGQTNAGKTSFCLRFARFLGLRELQWMVERTDGVRERRRMPLSEAEQLLSSGDPHRTRELQTLFLPVPRGKADRMVKVTDSAGLADGLHQDPTVRKAMAQTLRSMVDAKAIIHVIDAAMIGQELHAMRDGKTFRLHALDEQMLALGRSRSAYIVLANKMDLPSAKDGLRWLKQYFDKEKVIPISAREGSGFHEVKRYVWRLV
ncbi:GTPase domain-containing protein [Alicyclobacillus dauci]|uniref:GTPase domain-containing protein n=1 Tax=Alicyclobacillus dauci TaxID=1475485 RepID=A0ABY6YXJ1_9BACL|nr:GTPase domain-containing protein [Alicyclobacillus dauci]WAH35314.1 GTPase domain-containing protein [Alicyclobacillus dauci]